MGSGAVFIHFHCELFLTSIFSVLTWRFPSFGSRALKGGAGTQYRLQGAASPTACPTSPSSPETWLGRGSVAGDGQGREEALNPRENVKYLKASLQNE